MKRLLLSLFLLVFLPAATIGIGFVAVNRGWTYDRLLVSGSVRDQNGLPVSGATVFGVASWYNGHFIAEKMFRSSAGHAGAYALEGPNDLGASLAVFVTAPGHAPAWVWCHIRAIPEERSIFMKQEPVAVRVVAWLKGLALSFWPDCTADIVLSTQPTGLEVVVHGEDGQTAGLPVIAYPVEDELSPRRFWWRQDEPKQLADALSPVVTTGLDGVARFEHLLPGLYHVRVGEAALCERAGTCENAAQSLAWGIADGVAVSRGGIARVEVALSRRTIPPPEMIHFAAAGVLEVSPDRPDALSRPEPGSAAALITVLDAAGKPVQAEVELAVSRGQAPEGKGTTGPDGSIQFTGRPPGRGSVSVILPDVPAIDFGDCEMPLPSVDLLRGRTEVLRQPIVLTKDHRTSLVLRAQPVGYVHGVLRQPAGQTAKAARTTPFFDQSGQPGASIQYCESTGEFLAGPFAAGSVQFTVHNGGEGFGLPETKATAEIEPGQVVELDFSAPPLSAVQLMLDWTVSDVWLLGRDRLAARVFLADGVTPAWGARVFYYARIFPDPVAFALTDKQGEAHMTGLAPGHPAFDFDDGVSLPTAVAVALIPGTTGAVIMPVPTTLAGPLRMVLPAPVSAHGQVTTGGVAPPARPGTIWIRATCQDRGPLKWPLSQAMTADPAGRFVLSGLTPGRYLVQASDDDNWVSPAVGMVVGDTDPSPLSLDLPVPGATVLLHVVGQDGKPVTGVAVEADPPADGPVSDPWMSDQAGLIGLSRLGAGRHLLRSADDGTVVTIEVPPLPAPDLDVTMTVSKAAGMR